VGKQGREIAASATCPTLQQHDYWQALTYSLHLSLVQVEPVQQGVLLPLLAELLN
jgi:hypothetical protein